MTIAVRLARTRLRRRKVSAALSHRRAGLRTVRVARRPSRAPRSREAPVHDSRQAAGRAAHCLGASLRSGRDGSKRGRALRLVAIDRETANPHRARARHRQTRGRDSRRGHQSMTELPIDKHIQAARREVRVRAWDSSRIDAAWRELGLRRLRDRARAERLRESERSRSQPRPLHSWWSRCGPFAPARRRHRARERAPPCWSGSRSATRPRCVSSRGRASTFASGRKSAWS